MKYILAVLAIVALPHSALSAVLNPNGTTVVSNGPGYFMVCADGQMYYGGQYNTDSWTPLGPLPLPMSEIGQWAGNALCTHDGKLWMRSGDTWVRHGDDIPIPVDQIAAWDNGVLLGLDGTCWWYNPPYGRWDQLASVPCTSPVPASPTSVGDLKSMYR